MIVSELARFSAIDELDEKPRYFFLFWLPTALGAAFIIGVTTVAFLGFRQTPSAVTLPPTAPIPIAPAPSAAPIPVLPAPSSASPKPPTSTFSSSAPAAPSARKITGRYSVFASYNDAYIGEIRITNSGDEDQNWTARLETTPGTGELYTSWVESAEQPTLTVAGNAYTWKSTAPAPAGTAVILRFHFARNTGTDTPATCTVNGVRCS